MPVTYLPASHTREETAHFTAAIVVAVAAQAVAPAPQAPRVQLLIPARQAHKAVAPQAPPALRQIQVRKAPLAPQGWVRQVRRAHAVRLAPMDSLTDGVSSPPLRMSI